MWTQSVFVVICLCLYLCETNAYYYHTTESPDKNLNFDWSLQAHPIATVKLENGQYVQVYKEPGEVDDWDGYPPQTIYGYVDPLLLVRTSDIQKADDSSECVISIPVSIADSTSYKWIKHQLAEQYELHVDNITLSPLPCQAIYFRMNNFPNSNPIFDLLRDDAFHSTYYRQYDTTTDDPYYDSYGRYRSSYSKRNDQIEWIPLNGRDTIYMYAWRFESTAEQSNVVDIQDAWCQMLLELHKMSVEFNPLNKVTADVVCEGNPYPLDLPGNKAIQSFHRYGYTIKPKRYVGVSLTVE